MAFNNFQPPVNANPTPAAPPTGGGFNNFSMGAPTTNTSQPASAGAPTQTPAQNGGGGFLGGVVNALPTIGGIIGNVGARALDLGAGVAAAPETGGTSLIPAIGMNEAAGAAGGGAGQAAGELLKEFLQGQSIDPGKIANQGGQGAIYGAIPGGESGGILAKGAVRAGVGAVAGGAAQAVSDIGNNKSPSENAGNIEQAAGIGAVTFPVLGLAGDGLFHALGKALPGDLENLAIKQPEKVAQGLVSDIQDLLVKHANVPYAIEKGIIPTGDITKPAEGQVGRVAMSGLDLFDETIDTAISKAKQVASGVGAQLKTIFDAAPHVDLQKPFQEGGQSLMQMVEELRSLGTESKGAQIADTVYSAIPKGVDPSDMPLSVVNGMKTALGRYYDQLPGAPAAYNAFKDLVEKESGQPEVVRGLNEQFQKLANIQDQLAKNKGSVTLDKGLSAQGIKDAIEKAGQGAPDSLKTLAAWIAIGSMTAVGKAIGGVQGAIEGGAATTGIGMMMGVRNGISRVIDGMVSSPESKLVLSNGLRDLFNNSNQTIKAAIIAALRQVAVRVPGLSSSQPPATPPPTIQSTSGPSI